MQLFNLQWYLQLLIQVLQTGRKKKLVKNKTWNKISVTTGPSNEEQLNKYKNGQQNQ